MTPEQQVRLEILRMVLQNGHPLHIALEYAEKFLAWVLTGQRTESSFSYTEPTKYATENPLRIKVNASTGIPVEFSR